MDYALIAGGVLLVLLIVALLFHRWLLEEGDEEGVGDLVVDDEPGVDRQLADALPTRIGGRAGAWHVNVRVPAGHRRACGLLDTSRRSVGDPGDRLGRRGLCAGSR